MVGLNHWNEDFDPYLPRQILILVPLFYHNNLYFDTAMAGDSITPISRAEKILLCQIFKKKLFQQIWFLCQYNFANRCNFIVKIV